MARLIIAGSRTIKARYLSGGINLKHLQKLNHAVFWWLQEYHAVDGPFKLLTEVISGKEPTGVDRLGEAWAYLHNVPVKAFPAEWDKHGKAAGFIRNKQMAQYAAEEQGSGLVVLWDGESRGTSNMIKEAEKLDLYVEVTKIRI
jgi:hypothetical protein